MAAGPADPQLIDALRSGIAAFGGVRLALLVGSFARGGGRHDSDVDVAVIAPDVDLLELAAVLGQRVQREVDVVSLDTAGIPLLEEIVRDAWLRRVAERGLGG